MGAPSAPTHSLIAGQVVHQRAAPEVHSGLVIFVRKYTCRRPVLYLPLDDDMNTKIYDRKKLPAPPAGRRSSYFYDNIFVFFFLRIVSKTIPITDLLVLVSHTHDRLRFFGRREEREK